ncbi:MAG: hypothetical protein COA78_12965 [Blastopirellula sp.]|nr:MAG: hypothetical protein COA78_12965 [Blastopirellula sp.]
MRIALLSTLIFLATMSSSTYSADWAQFRGPNGSGIAEGGSPPVEFGPDNNQLWRVPVGSGHSSPCVVGDSIFLTTYHDGQKQLAVVCLNRKDGAVRWRRKVPHKQIEKGHPSFNPASSTPVSDGKVVVAYFGSYGLICFDMNGAKQWDIPMPLAKSYGGNAISPIIVDDKVIHYRGNFSDHYLLAVNIKTGEEIWKTPLTERFSLSIACTATPIVADDKIILHAANSVKAFDIASGKIVWQAACKTTATSTPVLAGNEVVVATWNQTGESALTPVYPPFEDLLAENDKDGDKSIAKSELPKMMIFHRSEGTEAPANGMPLRFDWIDSNKNGKINQQEWTNWQSKSEQRRAQYKPHGMIAINVNNEGELGEDQLRTLEEQGIPEVPSPLYYDGFVYFVKNGGIITCINLKTGKREYRKRTGGTGTHYASPVIANGNMYTTSGDGDISVIRLGTDPEVLTTNKIGEQVYATPAIVDSIIYVRTHKALYAFGKNPLK